MRGKRKECDDQREKRNERGEVSMMIRERKVRRGERSER